MRLTEAGREALAANSVLDPERLGTVLAGMGAGERRKAVEGLKLLAAAARKFREGGG